MRLLLRRPHFRFDISGRLTALTWYNEEGGSLALHLAPSPGPLATCLRACGSHAQAGIGGTTKATCQAGDYMVGSFHPTRPARLDLASGEHGGATDAWSKSVLWDFVVSVRSMISVVDMGIDNCLLARS